MNFDLLKSDIKNLHKTIMALFSYGAEEAGKSRNDLFVGWLGVSIFERFIWLSIAVVIVFLGAMIIFRSDIVNGSAKIFIVILVAFLVFDVIFFRKIMPWIIMGITEICVLIWEIIVMLFQLILDIGHDIIMGIIDMFKSEPPKSE